MADPLAHPAVRRVQAALAAAGSGAQVIALASTARSAEDAAQSIGTPLGSIVKSLVFTVGGAPVMALVAGRSPLRPQGVGAGTRSRGESPPRRCRPRRHWLLHWRRCACGSRDAASRRNRRELGPLRDRLRRRRPPALRLRHDLGRARAPHRRHRECGDRCRPIGSSASQSSGGLRIRRASEATSCPQPSLSTCRAACRRTLSSLF